MMRLWRPIVWIRCDHCSIIQLVWLAGSYKTKSWWLVYGFENGTSWLRGQHLPLRLSWKFLRKCGCVPSSVCRKNKILLKQQILFSQNPRREKRSLRELNQETGFIQNAQCCKVTKQDQSLGSIQIMSIKKGISFFILVMLRVHCKH